MNTEVVGLIGLSLLMQVAFMFLVYKEYNPLYRAILGMVAMLCWFATGHVSLSLNPNEGIAISAVYDAIAILDTLFAAKAALDFMQLSQGSDDFWGIT